MSNYRHDLGVSEELAKDYKKWCECRDNKTDCYCYNNVAGKCMALTDSDFKDKWGNPYRCPFYKPTLYTEDV